MSIYGGEETEGEFVYRNGDPVLWDTEYTHDREVLAICNPAISEIPYYFGWQYEGYSMNYFGQQTLLEDHKAAVYGGNVPFGTARRRHRVIAHDVLGNQLWIGEARWNYWP